MGVMSDDIKERLRPEFAAEMVDEVKLVVFTQEIECDLCRNTREIVEELTTISEKIKVEVYDLVKDVEKVKEYSIDRIPAIAVVGKKDYGIRYYGIPSGYEFSSLVQVIITVSKGVTGILEESRAKLKTVNKPIRIKIFVTPTCPYCPKMVKFAYQFAMENELIKTDVLEAAEYPELVQKYSIMATPKIVINETLEIIGVTSEEYFVDQVIRAQYPPPTETLYA
ncbi:MAG TPA: thioredoxin family protein [archaeon]|nr:thioredoxin family protein [archaeon]